MPVLHVLVYGFSIFSMFFGSGNLVFPLKIGAETGGNWFAGFAGLFLTGILLPFLGLIVIKIHRGSYINFFSEGGKLVRYVMPLLTLSLLGSFGVLPRCITVAHGGIEHLFPDFSTGMFAMIFSAAAFIVGLRDRWMISVLGRFLTPILLGFLAFLVLYGITNAPQQPAEHVNNGMAAFLNGFFQGYETMDLFAAFFFSSVIFRQIEERNQQKLDTNQVFRLSLYASITGAMLLGFVYLGFVCLGSLYGPVARFTPPEQILPLISFNLIGEHAGVVLAVIIILSCLTTFVALNNIYARYLVTTLRFPEKTFPWVLMGTSIISCFFSRLDFQGISAFLSPILEVTYPGLIALSLISLIFRGYPMSKKILFYAVTLTVMCWKLIH